MGEREHSYHAEDRGQTTNPDSGSLETQEPATVPGSVEHEGTRDTHKDRDTLMDISVREGQAVKPRRTSHPSVVEPTGHSPLLQAFGDLYIAKELYRAEVEDRKEKDRQRKAQYRKEHPEEYNAYQREYMREYMRKRRASKRQ